VRVFGLETRGRNKRERGGNPQGGTIDQSRASAKDLSLSTYAATRKMVNYSRAYLGLTCLDYPCESRVGPSGYNWYRCCMAVVNLVNSSEPGTLIRWQTLKGDAGGERREIGLDAKGELIVRRMG